MSNDINANAEMVINELLSEVAQLNKDKAIANVLATQYKQELDKLKKPEDTE